MEKQKGTNKMVEDLNVENVVELLSKWEMKEFQDFVVEKEIDGRKLMEVTEGVVKLWKPKANAKKFIEFTEQLKLNSYKFLEVPNKDLSNVNKEKNEAESSKMIEAQYQTVGVKKCKEQSFTSITSGVEDILQKIVPAKSFLYRNLPTRTEKPVTSYVPMDASTLKKPKRFFRLSSYEHPHFDLKHFRFSKTENYNDRGYYSVKTGSRYFIQKSYEKPESRTKYKSFSTTEELVEKCPEDHFYEDLNYNDMKKDESSDDIKELNTNQTNLKPRMVKIQELFSSFKLPFFKKTEDLTDKNLDSNAKCNDGSEKDRHVYENSESIANMYDSIHIDSEEDRAKETNKHPHKIPVEEYLEPVQLSKEYSDVTPPRREESFLGLIISLLESRFGRREANDTDQSEGTDKDPCTPEAKRDEKKKTNMADRPLPVPVENEPYYMNIERTEAENLLKGHPDGTFILRPSSQPNHAYTLTVSCSNAVHNVGVRRRPDSRLALGYARRGERSFESVTSLLRHHRKRRLLLVAGGRVCGATTLNEPPLYYQTPRNLPIVF